MKNFLKLLWRKGAGWLALGLLLSCATSVARADPNDLFVSAVILEPESYAELNPGDPVRYTVYYGRTPAGEGEHGKQEVEISIYLSTDGDPLNINNFKLDFFRDVFPEKTSQGSYREEIIINRLPPNFTGTYFLIAYVEVIDGAGDPDLINNYPPFTNTGSARVTVRSADSPVVSRVSTSGTGTPTNELSESPAISGDGRYVVFQSEATNIVSSPSVPAGISQIYLKDMLTGAVTLISQLGGVAGNQESKYPVICAYGDADPLGGSSRFFVAYQSAATNLISGTGANDTNQQTDIFLYDVAQGVTTRISVPTTAPFGQQANGGSFLPTISGMVD